MFSMVPALLAFLSAAFRTRVALQLEILALRHQIGMLRHAAKKQPKVTVADRLLWAWLGRVWAGWRPAVVMVKPETVMAWHRKGFCLFWAWKIRRGQPGRPPLSRESPDLIRKMSRENPL